MVMNSSKKSHSFRFDFNQKHLLLYFADVPSALNGKMWENV